jgi:hypothetical protein
MTAVPRLLALGCLALTLSVCAEAQAHSAVHKFPSEATIENWLLSDNPRLVAWGAHDVILSRNEALTTDLLNLATQWEPLTWEKADGSAAELSHEQLNKRDAMAAILDALIQMNVPVPGEPLRSLAPDFPNDTAILLSRMSPEEAEQLALDFYRSPPPSGYGLQYVSAALLAQHPPSGFAADLLAGIKLRADIYVVLPQSGGFGGGYGGSAGCCMLAGLPLRTDWPPIGQYSLSMEKGNQSVLLVSGIDPIYATRYESDSYRDPCGGPWLGPDQRRRLIAEMLGVSADAIPWMTRVSTTVVFYSDEQFRRNFLRFIGEQEQQYRATAIALADRGTMTTAEVEQSAPKLEIYTNDMRGADTSPLPTIAPLPGNAEWLNEPAWK